MSAILEKPKSETKVTRPESTFDRTKQDVGNIIFLEHVNLRNPDQKLATAFYVMGLGLTRDPYMRTGLTNMGINVGRGQIHMPMSGALRGGKVTNINKLRGTIGLVLPDLDFVAKSLETAARWLEGTEFSYKVYPDRVEATCPWGNRYRCHAPAPEFGDTDLALAYIEFDLPRGTAPAIARFYREALLAITTVEQHGNDAVARVDIGASQKLLFHETDAPIPPYDGHHFQIYIADYSGPHRFLKERGLVTEVGEQWAFIDIIDLDTGKGLFQVEHEMRCLKHASYNRALVNRNPYQTDNNREGGHDAFRGSVGN